MMLQGEHVAKELSDPLATLNGQFEAGNHVANGRLDPAPEERRILLGKVGGPCG